MYGLFSHVTDAGLRAIFSVDWGYFTCTYFRHCQQRRQFIPIIPNITLTGLFRLIITKFRCRYMAHFIARII